MLTWVAACVVAAALFGVAPMIARGNVPQSPSNLVAVASDDPLLITLTWSASPDPDLVGYNVYVAQQAAGPYARVASGLTTGTFDYATSVGGLAHYFRVAAVDSHGDESAPVSVGPVGALWSMSPHIPSTMNSVRCPQCHTLHLASDSLLMSQDLGASPASTSCLGCHNGQGTAAANVATGTADSFALASGHSVASTVTAGGVTMNGCVTCHWAHGEAATRPMIPARKVNGAAVSSAGAELCLSCHDASDSWYGPGYPSTANPTRDATGFPVLGTWPGPATYSSAGNAHRLIPETTQTTTVGKPVRRDQGACLYCHTSHRGPNGYDGLRNRFTAPTASTLASDQAQGTYAAVCFDCHGGATPSGFSTPTVNIKQFATAAGRGGHSIVTTGGDLPAGAPLPCYECHNPHGSKRGNGALVSDERGRNLITTDTAGAITTETAGAVRTFCFTCHTTPSGTGWNSVSEAYESVAASEKVVGLTRTGGPEDSVLHLPDYVGHAETETASCYLCHKNSYSAGGNNVHNPGVGVSHMAMSSDECADCHGADLLTVHAATTLRRAVAFTTVVRTPSTTLVAGSLYSAPAPLGPVGMQAGTMQVQSSLSGALCATCHNGKYGDIASAVGSAECLDCHNSTRMPGRSWADTSTAETLGQRLMPHYDSHVTTHTVGSWDGGVDNTGGYSCTQCHDPKLWDSHSGPTPISIDTSATWPRNTRCTACHSVVSPWGRPSYGQWSAQPSGAKCSACHPVSADHTDIATKHDASSEVMASPGSSSVVTTAAATAVSQSFATATWPADWTRGSATYIRVQNNAARVRSTYAAELYSASTTRRTFQFYRDVDLSGYQSATLTFWNYTAGFAGGTDYSLSEYSTDGGTTWIPISNLTASTAWTQRSVALPTGGTVRLRFGGSVNSTTEFCDWDDILVSGVTQSVANSPLPVGSTADASCQNNPNGTECHVVSDVAAIHDNTASRCTACHKNSTTAPVRNCQTAGCHASVNRDEHIQTGIGSASHHESQISTTTVMGSGFVGTQCTGCHDDSIANEHLVLSAYSATPCSICHKKTANSPAPSSVTTANVSATIAKAANTALCTDCHKTVSPTAPHVQRMGTTSTPGSTQFDTGWSGHRSFDTMFGSRTGGTTSTFNGQPTSISWTLPTATSWLKAGWTTTTQAVRCSDCHGSVTGAAGPHGAAMKVTIASGYDNSYSTGALTLSGTTMSNTTNICAKCHTTTGLGYNNVHNRGDHSGQPCIACHNKTPHAWKRPRLIGYTTDPAPYRATQVNSIRVKSQTPNAWIKTDCGAGCTGEHPTVSPAWP